MDRLRDLFIAQYHHLSGASRHLVDNRIREVATVVEDQCQGLLPRIDFNDHLHCVCLRSVLQPIYKVVADYLHEIRHEFIDMRAHVWEGFEEALWTNLHRYLVRHGFSVENAQEFVSAVASARRTDPLYAGQASV